jgi:hypothetical protein
MQTKLSQVQSEIVAALGASVNTVKVLHFGLMTIGTIGICVMGEPTRRHISD